MYSTYLYYKIENGTPWDKNLYYIGGEGLPDAEYRLRTIKTDYPKAYIKSYFLRTKLW